MRSTVVLFMTAAAFALPASALGAPVIAAPIPTASTAQGSVVDATPQPLNIASGRAAMIAYANYLQALTKAVPLAEQDTAQYVSDTSSNCKGALAPLTDPSYDVNTGVQANLSAVGQEIGDDLSVTYDGTALVPFTKLTASLSRLHWTKGSGGAMAVKHFIADQQTLLTSTPSNLCQDVLLMAAYPQKLPPASKTFLKEYTKDSGAADASLASFLTMLHTYGTASEHGLVTHIANLASQVNRLSESTVMTNATALTADLKSS